MITLDKDLLVCDLTQSYAATGGGGVGVFMREKRKYVLEQTGHRLLQIVPGPEDRVVEDGRHIWVEIGAEPVRGSPNYRFILRTGAVREVLNRYRPDVIESLCPWVLPWTAINYRRANPETVLVAGYHTDFPNVHIHRVGVELFGRFIAAGLRRIGVSYAGFTYREFDRVYALGGETCAMLESYGITHVDRLNLGVDCELFSPVRRDPALRRGLGIAGDGPLLVYAGRIDREKRADVLIEMFRSLPRELGATLLLLGEGKLRGPLLAANGDLPLIAPGFVEDRAALARALASADIYVSGMADETFGISLIEAQASGLPVVGVHSGAMPERVPAGLGLLGPPGDADAMARNVLAVWHGNHAAMGHAARAHVANQFSWTQTFERLFGDVYGCAFEQSQVRQAEPSWYGARSTSAGNSAA